MSRARKTRRTRKGGAQEADEDVPALTSDGTVVLRDGPLASGRTVVLQVVDVFRYHVDDGFRAVLSGAVDAADEYRSAYDLVLSDGMHKLKAVLSPTLNVLAERGVIQPHAFVRVTAASPRYDETEINEPAFVLLKSLDIIGQGTHTVRNRARGDVAFPGTVSEREQRAVPRIGSRGYYMALWSDDTPVGDAWKTELPGMPTAFMAPADHPTIQQILEAHQRKEMPPFPPLVGRVLRKSRLIHLSSSPPASSSSSRGYCPFQFTFSLADSSGAIDAVVWNSACLSFFSAITEGDVVAVEGFKLSRRFHRASEPMEVSINPRNPEGKISKLAPAQVRRIKLPEISFDLYSRAHLRLLPDETEFDMVAQLAEVSEPEREAVSSGAGFTEFRWVYLRDPSSPEPLRVQLYVNSQPEVFQQLPTHVGQAVLMTALRLGSLTMDSTERTLHARSTFHTRVFVDTALPRIPRCTEIAAWARRDGRGGAADAMRAALGPLRRHGKYRVELLREPTLAAFRRTFPKIAIAPLKDVALSCKPPMLW